MCREQFHQPKCFAWGVVTVYLTPMNARKLFNISFSNMNPCYCEYESISNKVDHCIIYLFVYILVRKKSVWIFLLCSDGWLMRQCVREEIIFLHPWVTELWHWWFFSLIVESNLMSADKHTICPNIPALLIWKCHCLESVMNLETCSTGGLFPTH